MDNELESQLREIAQSIFNRDYKLNLTHDILDTKRIIRYKYNGLLLKQIQMRYGEFWQRILGSCPGWRDLGRNHRTGLDLISRKHKCIIELKNRTNTDNSSSRKTNFDKLARYKKRHPEYRCIYATINADTESKTKNGLIKEINHNGVVIEHMIGYSIFTLIIGKDVDKFIQIARSLVREFLSVKFQHDTRD